MFSITFCSCPAILGETQGDEDELLLIKDLSNDLIKIASEEQEDYDSGNIEKIFETPLKMENFSKNLSCEYFRLCDNWTRNLSKLI